ncbi:MAG: 30S ribosomal protein S4 [Sedimentisphaerales bacterium]|nr:30S ribosomal protein S4 [Sedimentisphaerales bacterium]
MGRTLGPVCRLCRRESIKLMLKGARCETAKCPMERQDRNRPPGMFSWRRGRSSEFGIRLREKQKVKRYYGVLEKQFRLYFRQAERRRGNTGQTLLSLLERRLDNVIYKMHFAPSHRLARQIITHGHVKVNGRKCDIPSYSVRQGDKITLKAAEKTKKLIQANLEAEKNSPVQPWLQVDAQALEGVVVALPNRDDVQIPVEEQLIVEVCSR